MWKFHDFSTTQILREINIGDFRRAKSGITRLEALKFDFYEFLHLLIPDFYQMDKIHRPQKGKNSNFCTSRISKIDFT